MSSGRLFFFSVWTSSPYQMGAQDCIILCILWESSHTFFELTIKIRKIFKPDALCNRKNLILRPPQSLCCCRQSSFIQIHGEACPGHLLKPTHKMAAAASAALCHICYSQSICVIHFDLMKGLLQTLRIRRIQTWLFRIHTKLKTAIIQAMRPSHLIHIPGHTNW